jgi:hypothetical protein
MESIVESRSQIVSVAGDLFTVFGVHRMVAEGTRSKQKLLALREKGVYSSYTWLVCWSRCSFLLSTVLACLKLVWRSSLLACSS